jgi:hypothetical protein
MDERGVPLLRMENAVRAAEHACGVGLISGAAVDEVRREVERQEGAGEGRSRPELHARCAAPARIVGASRRRPAGFAHRERVAGGESDKPHKSAVTPARGQIRGTPLSRLRLRRSGAIRWDAGEPAGDACYPESG